MSGTPELREMLARCLEGVASDDEVARLDALLARDPGVARELARAAVLESNLEVVASAPSMPAMPAPVPLVRARRNRTGWAVAATSVAAAAAAGLLVWSSPRQPTTPLPIASAPVAVPPVSAPAVREPAAPAPADTGDRRVQFSDGSVAELRDGTSRVQTRLSTATTVEVGLEQGGARFEVVPRAGRRFRVWVGSVYVDVLGTVFTVDRLAGAVRVSVERGTVKVVSGRSETRVAAGGTQLVPLEKAVATAAKDEVSEWLHATELARRDGHPEQALALLRRVLDRHHGDPRAPYASFIMGRVLLEELAQPREAAAAFARVELLDPKTPLVQDALAREVESWARAGQAAQTRARARAYLDRYPNGTRADEVRRYSQME